MNEQSFKSIREALITELDYTNSNGLTTKDGYIYKVAKNQYLPLLDAPKEKKEIIPFSKALQSIRGHQY